MRSLKEKKSAAKESAPETLLKKVFPKKELPHIRFSYLRKGILGVEVDSSCRLYYLMLQKEDLLAKLCSKSSGIKDVRFYLGDVK